MDELNLQAERAAFEAFLREEAPHDYDASNSDAWHIWQAARRAAPVAQLDADLPPPDTHASRDQFGLPTAYSAAKVCEIAGQYVERIRHLEREAAELREASLAMSAELSKFQGVAYLAKIDGRTAGTALPEGYVIAPAEATEAMVHAAQDLPPPRMFGVVYRTMLAAAPSDTAGTASEERVEADPSLAKLAIEQKAKEIYCQLRGTAAYPWQEGGNSLTQDKARRMAEIVLAAIPPQDNTND